jgi:hypothetical protein
MSMGMATVNASLREDSCQRIVDDRFRLRADSRTDRKRVFGCRSITHRIRKIIIRAKALASVVTVLLLRSRGSIVVHTDTVTGGASGTTVGSTSRFAITSFHEGVHYLAHSFLDH